LVRYARDPHAGRGKVPETITGTGEDELGAITDLAIRLDERRVSGNQAANAQILQNRARSLSAFEHRSLPHRAVPCPDMTVTKRERAEHDVLELLPDGWRLGRACWNPGTQRWAVTARPAYPGRGKAPETLSGIGDDEMTAMTDLAIRLDERRRADMLAEVDRRGRLAFLSRTEQRSWTAEGRPLTNDELERATKRYPR
jgi:hypothetical protein